MPDYTKLVSQISHDFERKFWIHGQKVNSGLYQVLQDLGDDEIIYRAQVHFYVCDSLSASIVKQKKNNIIVKQRPRLHKKAEAFRKVVSSSIDFGMVNWMCNILE